MEYGFSYNGIHCKDMGCTYIPSEKRRLVLPEFSVSSADVAGRDGGYYYGSHQKIRTFNLECFFEDITEAKLRKISRWIDRNTAGALVFDERPEVVYHVRPSKSFEPELYEHVLDGNAYPTYSGKFSIAFDAYDPFGYLTKTELSTGETNNHMESFCGILPKDELPPAPVASDREFLMYNCGTEPCGMNLVLRGTAPNGAVLKNLTNGTSCKLIALPEDPSYLRIDADNCRVQYGFGDSAKALYENMMEDAFEFHDDGYILLEPYDELYKNVPVKLNAGSNIMMPDASFASGDHLIGKYAMIISIYGFGIWLKIEDVLNNGGQVFSGLDISEDQEINITIATMNEIVVEGEGLVLKEIHVSCSPKVL